MIHCLGMVSSYYILNFLKNKIETALQRSQYKRMVSEYISKRDQYISSLDFTGIDLNDPFNQKLLNSDVSELKGYLEKGQTTSENLVKIFTKKCITLGKEMNLITDINYEKALKRAQEFDLLRKQDPSKCKGELFGVVISIKETIDMNGFPSTSNNKLFYYF
jgi:fatty acid amide hydrolase